MDEDSAERRTPSDGDTPTTLEQMYAALVSHDATVTRHENRLRGQEAAYSRHEQILQELQQNVSALLARPPPTTAPASDPARTPRVEPRLPAPERYDGNPKDCRGFLTQCSLTFELQPTSFPSDRSRIAYIITLLTGKARAWATAIWEQQGRACSTYVRFTEEMRRVFDHPVGGRDAANRLFHLRQGNSSVAEYAVLFRTLAAESGWNMEALMAAFRHGLSGCIKDELAAKDPAQDLEDLIDQTIRLDNRLRERRRERQPLREFPTGSGAPLPHFPQQPPLDPEEPMQLGRSRLSQAERDRRMKERCCLYCGQNGHFRSACPELAGKAKPSPAWGGL